MNTPADANDEFQRAKRELTEKMRARDRDALRPPPAVFTEQDPADRAADWVDRHAGPSKYPRNTDVNIPAADRWIELPGDPPELRKWLAAQRRAAQ
jgi:hypothetical protein